MKRIPHQTWASILGVVYLGMMTNGLLVVGCLPLLVLLVTTDPMYSWPLLALAAPLCGPALTATAATFRAHAEGDIAVVRPFLRAWRETAWKSLAIAAAVVAALVVLLADVSVLSRAPGSVVFVPMLWLLAVIAAATGIVAFVALSEAPQALLRDVFKASLYLSVRRWYLSALSLVIVGVQAGLFTSMPAIAIGVTAAPMLYVIWANSRYMLRPVLDISDVVA